MDRAIGPLALAMLTIALWVWAECKFATVHRIITGLLAIGCVSTVIAVFADWNGIEIRRRWNQEIATTASCLSDALKQGHVQDVEVSLDKFAQTSITKSVTKVGPRDLYELRDELEARIKNQERAAKNNDAP